MFQNTCMFKNMSFRICVCGLHPKPPSTKTVCVCKPPLAFTSPNPAGIVGFTTAPTLFSGMQTSGWRNQNSSDSY